MELAEITAVVKMHPPAGGGAGHGGETEQENIKKEGWLDGLVVKNTSCPVTRTGFRS